MCLAAKAPSTQEGPKTQAAGLTSPSAFTGWCGSSHGAPAVLAFHTSVDGGL